MDAGPAAAFSPTEARAIRDGQGPTAYTTCVAGAACYMAAGPVSLSSGGAMQTAGSGRRAAGGYPTQQARENPGTGSRLLHLRLHCVGVVGTCINR